MRIARFTTGEDPRFGVSRATRATRSTRRVTGDPLYTPVQPTGERVPLEQARLLAPVIPRSKVIGVGRNYADHAAEMGNEVPAEPLMFLMPNTAVAGPGDPIVLPRAVAPRSHYEGELAVVIGRICKDVPAERAGEVILGYTCANDVTARDLQRSDGQWARAKGFDTFCPLGPVAGDRPRRRRPADQHPAGRRGRSRTARRRRLVAGSPSWSAYISAAFTLLPGDVILTGTPAGVGPLAAGQRVEVEIEGIGVLANPVSSAG